MTDKVCSQWYSNFIVDGSENGQEWLVQTHGPKLPMSCSCPAYRYSGEYGEQKCKHTKKVWMHGCFWHEDMARVPANTLSQNGVRLISSGGTSYGNCPGNCGGMLYEQV